MDEPPDLDLVVGEGVHRAPPVAHHLAEPGLGEVEPPGQLAHHQDVDPGEALGLERRRRDERGVDAHGLRRLDQCVRA